MKNVNFIVNVGAREIFAICIGIPLMYYKIRDIKFKYDKKTKEFKQDYDSVKSPVKFSDIIIDQDGNIWRREGR